MYANIYASRRKTFKKKFLLSTRGATFSFFQGEQLEAIPFTPLGTITMVPLKILKHKDDYRDNKVFFRLRRYSIQWNATSNKIPIGLVVRWCAPLPSSQYTSIKWIVGNWPVDYDGPHSLYCQHSRYGSF